MLLEKKQFSLFFSLIICTQYKNFSNETYKRNKKKRNKYINDQIFVNTKENRFYKWLLKKLDKNINVRSYHEHYYYVTIRKKYNLHHVFWWVNIFCVEYWSIYLDVSSIVAYQRYSELCLRPIAQIVKERIIIFLRRYSYFNNMINIRYIVCLWTTVY